MFSEEVLMITGYTVKFRMQKIPHRIGKLPWWRYPALSKTHKNGKLTHYVEILKVSHADSSITENLTWL